jgi:hypothetical protein
VPTVSVTPGRPSRHEGQVSLDAVNARAQASEIEGTVSFAAGAYNGMGGMAGGLVESKPLCVTPCVVNLPKGEHQINLSTTDADGNLWSITDTIQVGDQPTAYRAALGVERTHLGAQIAGLTLASIGPSLLLTGGIFYAIPGHSETAATPSESSPLRGPGEWMLGIGVVTTVVGIVLLMQGRTEEQSGTGVQWTPSGAVFNLP